MDALDVMPARRSIRRFTSADVSLEDEQKLIGIGHPGEKKKPRTQRQVSKVSYERFGERSR